MCAIYFPEYTRAVIHGLLQRVDENISDNLGIRELPSTAFYSGFNALVNCELSIQKPSFTAFYSGDGFNRRAYQSIQEPSFATFYSGSPWGWSDDIYGNGLRSSLL